MTNCNTIKRLIDEAGQTDVLPFEANHHLNGCAPCRRFADERATLRGLLHTMPRVNAPTNFDAQLKARMSQANAKPTFAWSSPALYLRFGAASAVLLVAIFVAQYNGMLYVSEPIASTGNTPPATTPSSRQGGNLTPGEIAKENVDPSIKPGSRTPVVEPRVHSHYVATTPARGDRRVRAGAVPMEEEVMPDRGPGLVVRHPGREVELPMLPVSLGAQQQLINRSSRSSVQPIAISF